MAVTTRLAYSYWSTDAYPPGCERFASRRYYRYGEKNQWLNSGSSQYWGSV